jgi:hypothetical protein
MDKQNGLGSWQANRVERSASSSKVSWLYRQHHYLFGHLLLMSEEQDEEFIGQSGRDTSKFRQRIPAVLQGPGGA